MRSCGSPLLPLRHHGADVAGRLIAEMRGGVDGDTAPRDLDGKQAVALHQLLHEAKFKDPCGDHLSPAGAGPLAATPWSVCDRPSPHKAQAGVL